MAKRKRTSDPAAAPDAWQETAPVTRWQRPAGVPDGAMPGIVVRAFGKWFSVQLRDEPRQLLSTIKGTVRRERLRTDLVAVGDRVWVTDVGDDEGRIEAVEPRKAVLSRLARRTQDVEQVILANPDQALFLFAIRQPEPHVRMLDRFLVLAESRNLPAIIGINKVDLDEGPPGEAETLARSLFSVYEPHYTVVYLSVRDGRGIDGLLGLLRGKVTVVAGPSGAGKSSLLNRLDPERERVVGAISDATGKGRHTTTAAELYRIESETFVADTPGIRALAISDIPRADLDRYFPELRPFLGECFYADCTHIHEPGCAVRAAVENGVVNPARYESYVSMRQGDAATD